MIASETALRHQPMNWRDSIRVQTSVTQEAFPKREKLTQRLVPYSENKGYASNPRRFQHGENKGQESYQLNFKIQF